MLLAHHRNERGVFLYGFAKNERDNIESDELTTLKEIASAWLAADSATLETAIADGALRELNHDA
jgi:hypothetical protein